MPKKTKVLSDKYKSTTKIYPKVIMDSLTPEVKEYIEGQGVKIDDTTTSTTKVWSSQKTNTEVGNAKDKGVYYTTTEPTLQSANYYGILLSNISNKDDNIALKPKDIIIYINNGSVDSVYHINTIIGTSINVVKVGSFGGDKQLYQHNIHYDSSQCQCIFTIINTISSPMYLIDIAKYLYDNGFNQNTTSLMASGCTYTGSNDGKGVIIGVYSTNGTTITIRTQRYDMGTTSSTSGYNSPSITDKIIAL